MFFQFMIYDNDLQTLPSSCSSKCINAFLLVSEGHIHTYI